MKLPRRDLLRAAAVAAPLSALSPAAPPAGKITPSVMLWTLKGPVEKRLEVAAQAGCKSVELVGEHVNWTGPQAAEFKQTARSLGLGIDTIIGVPNWKTRPVSMVEPAHREGFLNDVRQAIGWAQKLEVPQIILMSGDEIPGRPREQQFASALEGAKRAGDLAAQAKVTLIIEPLNAKVNHKDYFLATCVEGLELVRRTDNPHVRLLFDLYHEQVQIGNVIRTLQAALPYVAVFHVADNPGRNDPGTGEMNYPNIYKAIRATGYSGYITMEYVPLGDQAASLTKAVRELREAWA
jgi:hydroxypyruvate isomerase